MSQPKPAAESILPWLRANLGKHALAPLTGTDARALQAAAQIIELYSYNRDPEILDAFRIVVSAMQRSTREFAYHAIAHSMEWSDRETLWTSAGLERIRNPRVCEFEPGGESRA